MARIFFIGGTGHIGGAVLHKTVERNANALVTVLVRDAGKAQRLVSKYPQVKPVIGDLESFAVIEAASREADIVINAAPDITHDKAIESAINGLTGRSTKGYYIHTSGASILWDEPNGSKEARTWDDVDDIADVLALDLDKTHSVTDNLVRNAAADVNVAIISPGFVGGMSPSIEHPTPITTPGFILTSRAFKAGFQIAQGENQHAWIHVEDIADMYMLLVEKALAADQNCWGKEAYYFGVGEVIPFSDLMQRLAPVLHKHGVIESAKVQSVDTNDAAKASMYGANYSEESVPPAADSWAMHIAIMYGVNMRLRATRMTKLGWKPQKGPIVETFDEVFGSFLRSEREAADKGKA
ncbi:nucleoside-diphosphate-sugar epimerase protein [Apiospora hydei]|uniref:Nucleoside-diphosphate-sugar epimerase protein n=1 Tax=Apiospora hydei TaxID=1337664 RepID=A0ABR1V4T8_9PEZI